MAARKAHALKQLLRLRRIEEYERHSLAADARARLHDSRTHHHQVEREAEAIARLRDALSKPGGAIEAHRYWQMAAYDNYVRSQLDEARQELEKRENQHRKESAAWAGAKKTADLTEDALQTAVNAERHAKKQRESNERDALWLASRGNRDGN